MIFFLVYRAALLVLDENPLIQNVTVEYIPQLGYLVAVDAAEAQFLDSNRYIFKYEDAKQYFKCSIVEDLDDRIGDIKNNILDFQKRISLEIEEEILLNETQLYYLSSALGTFDSLISLGRVATERGYSRPEITDSDVIVIKNGRHPLQEMTTNESFIPNDTCLLPEKNVALITGTY